MGTQDASSSEEILGDARQGPPLSEQGRLEAILEGTGAGTWEWNVETGETRFNARWAEIIGYTLEELAPISIQTWIDHAHPEDLARSGALLERHFAGELPAYECEARMRHRDGHWVWVLDRGRLFSRTAEGKPEWMFGTHLDITERVEQRRALELAHERLELATESGGVGVWELDLDSGEVRWSEWMCRLHDVGDAEVPAHVDAWIARIHAQDRAAFQHALTSAAESRSRFELEYRTQNREGEMCFLRALARVQKDESRKLLRLVGVCWDMSPLRRASAQLAEQHERMRTTLRSIGDAVITTDATGRIHWLNPAAERLTAWSEEEARGRFSSEVMPLLSESTRKPLEDLIALCLAKGEAIERNADSLLVSRRGGEYAIEESAAPICNEEGSVLGVVLVYHDVSEQRRLSRQLSHQATHDALTGLVNRSEFEARLARSLERAQRQEGEGSLPFIDLDQFKVVNDACGHVAGDEMLRQAAKLLAERVRSSDTVARLGGDEFGVLLEGCPAANAERVAQKICDTLSEFRFVHDGRRFRTGASIGIVPIDERWGELSSLMQAADGACYEAKQAGRNRFHAWVESDFHTQTRSGEARWATRLEQALDENRFVLFAQRIESLADDEQGLHLELLIRLLGEEGELIPPGAFLPAAERFNVASRIDQWVLGSAIDWLRRLPNPAALESLCINVSGQSLVNRAFHRYAIDSLTSLGREQCQRLCLEITETSAVTNLVEASHFIESVRSLGVRIALDDFGAGASSFGYLRHLGVDVLKIDGQFIREVVDNPLSDVAVRCFVDVARVVGVKTIAEFVDAPAVLHRIRDLGVDYAQGFLLHRPEPIERVLLP